MDSAEKWKQFAEGVQAQAAELGEQLAGVQAELQASRFVLSVLVGCACAAVVALPTTCKPCMQPNWLRIAAAVPKPTTGVSPTAPAVLYVYNRVVE